VGDSFLINLAETRLYSKEKESSTLTPEENLMDQGCPIDVASEGKGAKRKNCGADRVAQQDLLCDHKLQRRERGDLGELKRRQVSALRLGLETAQKPLLY